MRNFIILLAIVLIVAGCSTSGETAPTTPNSRSVSSSGGDAERGHEIFSHGLDQAPPCSTCHKTVAGATGFSIGPNLAGVGERGQTRVEGLDAAGYIRQSILEPHRFVVSGYRDIMFPDYSEHLADQDVDDLVAYLLTL